MTKQVFIHILQENLEGQIPENEVSANLRFYQNYIETPNESRTEEELLGDLGDPRLIAKTIVETYHINHKSAGNSNDNSYMYKQTRGSEYRNSRGIQTNLKAIRLGCLLSSVILLVVLGILLYLGALAIKLMIRLFLPFLLIIIGIVWIRKKMK